MKKFLVLVFSLLCIELSALASWESGLSKINNVLNTIDRTEYTINRVKNKVYVPSTPSKTKTKTYGQNSTQNTRQTTYPQNTTQNYNVDVPEYSQEQTVQEGNHKYSQDRIYKGQASTLGELPAGAIVMDPKSVWKFRDGSNYSGDIKAEHPVFWRKLEDNHYTDGATLLLSELKVAEYPFCHNKKGLRAWDESDVRRFLRTTFYNHLSDGFKNAIVEVNIPYVDMNGTAKTIKDNFFFLSIVEWGLSDRINNGSVIKYNDLPNIYGAKEFKYHEADSYGKGFYDISIPIYKSWTRTINRPEAESAGYRRDVFYIDDNGTLDTDVYHWSIMTVRPAVNIKSSTKVNGPYKFVYDDRYKHMEKTLIYYVLEF